MNEPKEKSDSMEKEVSVVNNNFEMTEARIDKQTAWMENYWDAVEELEDV